MKKISKDSIKEEVDKLPDSVLERLHKFIRTLAKKEQKAMKLKSLNLGGHFDDADIRSAAYEHDAG